MRRTLKVTVSEKGSRDDGKHFLITEMPADQAEAWAIRVLLAVARSGVDLPENLKVSGEGLEEEVAKMGMAGVAQIGFKALSGISWEIAKPLLDEMMGCIEFVGNPTQLEATRRPLIPDDIDEVKTRLELRRKVFTLHTGFFPSGGTSTSTSADPAAGSSETT